MPYSGKSFSKEQHWKNTPLHLQGKKLSSSLMENTKESSPDRPAQSPIFGFFAKIAIPRGRNWSRIPVHVFSVFVRSFGRPFLPLFDSSFPRVFSANKPCPKSCLEAFPVFFFGPGMITLFWLWFFNRCLRTLRRGPHGAERSVARPPPPPHAPRTPWGAKAQNGRKTAAPTLFFAVQTVFFRPSRKPPSFKSPALRRTSWAWSTAQGEPLSPEMGPRFHPKE